MNAEMFVQDQISDRRGYFRVDLLNIQYQSNCKEKDRDATLVALSFWFVFTGVKRPSASRPYGTRSIFGKAPFTTFNLRRFVWRDRRMHLSALSFRRSSGENKFPIFLRHIRLESRACQYVSRSNARRMRFHASSYPHADFLPRG